MQAARVALLFVFALLLVAPASAASYGYGGYGGYGYGGRKLLSTADLDFEPAHLTHSRGLLASYGSGYGYGGYGTYGRRRLLSSDSTTFQPRRSLLASYGGYGYGYGY